MEEGEKAPIPTPAYPASPAGPWGPRAWKSGWGTAQRGARACDRSWASRRRPPCCILRTRPREKQRQRGVRDPVNQKAPSPAFGSRVNQPPGKPGPVWPRDMLPALSRVKSRPPQSFPIYLRPCLSRRPRLLHRTSPVWKLSAARRRKSFSPQNKTAWFSRRGSGGRPKWICSADPALTRSRKSEARAPTFINYSGPVKRPGL